MRVDVLLLFRLTALDPVFALGTLKGGGCLGLEELIDQLLALDVELLLQPERVVHGLGVLAVHLSQLSDFLVVTGLD